MFIVHKLRKYIKLFSKILICIINLHKKCSHLKYLSHLLTYSSVHDTCTMCPDRISNVADINSVQVFVL